MDQILDPDREAMTSEPVRSPAAVAYIVIAALLFVLGMLAGGGAVRLLWVLR